MINQKKDENKSKSENKILCHNCLEREDCFETYLKKTKCEDHKGGPVKQPKSWPKEMSGPYGTYRRYKK